MPNRSNLLSCLRLLCVAAAGVLATGQAAVAEPQEIKVVEHAYTDAVTDTGAAGDTAGDILTFANEVFDADDKNKVGTDQGICFRTLVGKAWECFWTLSLDKGQITVEGPFLDAGDSVLAITGGTGEFAGATGDMALSARHRRQGLRFHLQNQVVAARAKPIARNATDPIRLLRIGYSCVRKGEGAPNQWRLPRELDATSSVLVINAPFSDVTGGVSKLRSRVLGEWPTRRNVAAGRSWPRVAHAPMRQTPRWRGLLLTLRPRRPPQRAAPISRMPRSVKPTLPIPISAMLCSVMPILQAQIWPRPI